MCPNIWKSKNVPSHQPDPFIDLFPSFPTIHPGRQQPILWGVGSLSPTNIINIAHHHHHHHHDNHHLSSLMIINHHQSLFHHLFKNYYTLHKSQFQDSHNQKTSFENQDCSHHKSPLITIWWFPEMGVPHTIIHL